MTLLTLKPYVRGAHRARNRNSPVTSQRTAFWLGAKGAPGTWSSAPSRKPASAPYAGLALRCWQAESWRRWLSCLDPSAAGAAAIRHLHSGGADAGQPDKPERPLRATCAPGTNTRAIRPPQLHLPVARDPAAHLHARRGHDQHEQRRGRSHVTEPNVARCSPGAAAGPTAWRLPERGVGTPGPLDGYCGTGDKATESAGNRRTPAGGHHPPVRPRLLPPHRPERRRFPDWVLRLPAEGRRRGPRGRHVDGQRQELDLRGRGPRAEPRLLPIGRHQRRRRGPRQS